MTMEREKIKEELQVVDTSNMLTKDELMELKRLAAMSKSAKLIIGIVFSIMMLFGVDHISEWMKKM